MKQINRQSRKVTYRKHSEEAWANADKAPSDAQIWNYSELTEWH